MQNAFNNKNQPMPANLVKSAWIPPPKSIQFKQKTEYLHRNKLPQKYVIVSDEEQEQSSISESQIKSKYLKSTKKQKKKSKRIPLLDPKSKPSKSKDKSNEYKPPENKKVSSHKRKMSKKKSSASHEKKSQKQMVVDVDISKEILKNRIMEKDKEIMKYRSAINKLDAITRKVQEYSNLAENYSLQNSLSFIQNIIENQIKNIFPVFAKLIQYILAILQEPIDFLKTYNNSNMHTEAPISPINLNASRLIKIDIEKLQKQLQFLKEQSFRLKPTQKKSEMSLQIMQLKKKAREQQEQLLQIYEMQILLEKYKYNTIKFMRQSPKVLIEQIQADEEIKKSDQTVK